MKKKVSVILILLLSLTLLLTNNTQATPGKLTRSSIEKCGGTLWGYHNVNRRHYHKAVYHKKSGYYALDWSHEYKRVGKCKYKLATAKKKKKKSTKSTVKYQTRASSKSSGTSAHKSYKAYTASVDNPTSESALNNEADVSEGVASNTGDVAQADNQNSEDDVQLAPFDSTPNENTIDSQVTDDNKSDVIIGAIVGAIIGVGVALYFKTRRKGRKKR